jgi:hypothetical protein
MRSLVETGCKYNKLFQLFELFIDIKTQKLFGVRESFSFSYFWGILKPTPP